MKMCQSHWDKIIAAIKERGLWHLVAQSGEEAVTNLQKEAAGEACNYDPLMAVNNMIFARAIEQGGLYLMAADYCPICEVMKYHAGGVDADGKTWTAEMIETHWVDGLADIALDVCRDLKLMPPKESLQ
jgi:hypothetical protein